MATEPITGLTYQEAASLQTDVLQNEMLNYFSAWCQCVTLTKGGNTPPGSPSEGDRHIVGTSPTGAWAGQANALAVYRNGAWQFYAPSAGFSAYNVGDTTVYRYNGSAWA